VVTNPLDLPPGYETRVTPDMLNGTNGHVDEYPRFRLTPISSVKRRSVSIVPCGLNIPIGTISIVCGTQGLGKSLITCYAAAELTRHGHGVMFIAEEDSIGAVIKPRLEAVQADLTRVYFPEVERHDDLGGILLPKDTLDLATLAREADIMLMVVDPWTNHLDGDVDKGAVRAALMPIARAARDGAFSVILVAHPTKRTDGNPLSQIAHASAVSQVARSAFMLAADPENTEAKTTRENPYRLLCQEKANLTESATTLRFKIETITLPADNGEPEVTTARVVSDGTSMLDWAGIRQLETRKASPHGSDTKITRATEWLRMFLPADGMEKPDVLEAAEDEGFAKRTIERAAGEACHVVHQPPKPAVWIAKTVQFANETPQETHGEVGELGEMETRMDSAVRQYRHKNVTPARAREDGELEPDAPESDPYILPNDDIPF